MITNPFLECNNMILSPTEEISIQSVAKIIGKYFGFKKLKTDRTYSDGQYKKTCDNSKLVKTLNIELTPLKDGLEKTMKWFIDNYSNARK